VGGLYLHCAGTRSGCHPDTTSPGMPGKSDSGVSTLKVNACWRDLITKGHIEKTSWKTEPIICMRVGPGSFLRSLASRFYHQRWHRRGSRAPAPSGAGFNLHLHGERAPPADSGQIGSVNPPPNISPPQNVNCFYGNPRWRGEIIGVGAQPKLVRVDSWHIGAIKCYDCQGGYNHSSY